MEITQYGRDKVALKNTSVKNVSWRLSK